MHELNSNMNIRTNAFDTLPEMLPPELLPRPVLMRSLPHYDDEEIVWTPVARGVVADAVDVNNVPPVDNNAQIEPLEEENNIDDEEIVWQPINNP